MKDINQMPDILGMPIYSTLSLRDYSVDQIIQLLTFHEEMTNKHTISSLDCFCGKCGRLTTFNSKNSLKETLEEIYLAFKASQTFNRLSDEWEYDFNAFFPVLRKIEFFHRSFYCPREPNDKTHDVTIIFRVTEDNLTKIGQFPQLADLENTHLKKYIELDKEIFKELNRATGLHSHGIGVGSFVYLRRIIEKFIVYPEIEELIANEIFTKEHVYSLDFKGKVSLAKDNLPTILVENPRIYSILSKGIHTLSEQECLEIFQPLLLAIEMILDERLEKIERDKKIRRMQKDLNRIANNG